MQSLPQSGVDNPTARVSAGHLAAAGDVGAGDVGAGDVGAGDVAAGDVADGDTDAQTGHVVVRGVLGSLIRSAFAECEIVPVGDETHLAAPLRDQASLYGVLDRLQDFGLTLVSVSVYPGRDSGVRSRDTARETCGWCGVAAE
jgi:hypothetical protein